MRKFFFAVVSASLTLTLGCPAAKQSSASSALSGRGGVSAQGCAVNGCWIQIWEDENFHDDNDIICGPVESSDMKNLPGATKTDWGDEIDSLKVGPHARVRVFEDENYGDNSAEYGPGTEKTNLRGDPDMGDQIDSMKLECI